MFGFLQSLKIAKHLPRHALTQTRNITSKSARGKIGAAESVFVMGLLSVAVLGPAGWILSSSCDSHRKRQ